MIPSWSERLAAMLPPDLSRPCFHAFDAIGSTNEEARRLALAGARHGTLVIADRQEAGRGREGRAWHSPTGGVWLSIVTRPELPLEVATLLPATTAVAAADAIEAHHAVKIGLKWPNDLVLADRKLGGILVESASRGDRLEWAVVGVGINVHTRLEEFPEGLRGRATSLWTAGVVRGLDREALAATVYDRVLRRTAELARAGPGPALEAYAVRDALLGRRVAVQAADGGRIEGTARGLDPGGALVVEGGSGRTLVHSGSVVAIGP
jgi:BirA family biotin operon repressor/biotin-[acetyl-CoA-carboxylase] ligase